MLTEGGPREEGRGLGLGSWLVGHRSLQARRGVSVYQAPTGCQALAQIPSHPAASGPTSTLPTWKADTAWPDDYKPRPCVLVPTQHSLVPWSCTCDLTTCVSVSPSIRRDRIHALLWGHHEHPVRQGHEVRTTGLHTEQTLQKYYYRCCRCCSRMDPADSHPMRS